MIKLRINQPQEYPEKAIEISLYNTNIEAEAKIRAFPRVGHTQSFLPIDLKLSKIFHIHTQQTKYGMFNQLQTCRRAKMIS